MKMDTEAEDGSWMIRYKNDASMQDDKGSIQHEEEFMSLVSVRDKGHQGIEF
jgi:hypothetical protein